MQCVLNHTRLQYTSKVQINTHILKYVHESFTYPQITILRLRRIKLMLMHKQFGLNASPSFQNVDLAPKTHKCITNATTMATNLSLSAHSTTFTSLTNIAHNGTLMHLNGLLYSKLTTSTPSAYNNTLMHSKELFHSKLTTFNTNANMDSLGI